jgi:hypothetical protein
MSSAEFGPDVINSLELFCVLNFVKIKLVSGLNKIRLTQFQAFLVAFKPGKIVYLCSLVP